MDDMQEKIAEILSNEEAMAALRSVSQMLSVSGNRSENTGYNEVGDDSEASAKDRGQQANPQQTGGFDVSQIVSALSQSGILQDGGAGANRSSGSENQQPDGGRSGNSGAADNFAQLQMITKLMPVIRKMNSDNEETRFLDALKPLVSQQRRGKVEQAKRFVRIFSLMKGTKL